MFQSRRWVMPTYFRMDVAIGGVWHWQFVQDLNGSTSPWDAKQSYIM